MSTSSGVKTVAAGLEAVEGRLRSAESWEAAAENLGPTGSLESAVENLGPTGGLETAAAYELDLITAGEAAAQQGSGSSAAVATAGSGASAGAATSDAAIVAYRIEMGECIKHVARQGRTWSSSVIGIPPESVAHPTEPQTSAPQAFSAPHLLG